MPCDCQQGKQPCRECKGAKTSPAFFGLLKKTCSKCKGAGTEAHWRCDGTGITKCDRCKGNGYAESCSECKGTGSRTCEHCSGLGWKPASTQSAEPAVQSESNVDITQQLTDLLLQGHKIQAIKLQRECTGQGLAEAKGYVEALEAGLHAEKPTDVDLAKQLKHLLLRGRKIDAIKLQRECTGQGLEEAKGYVEALEAGLQAAKTTNIDIMQQLTDLLLQGRKIDAVKLQRESTGQGLSEAKKHVDTLEAQLRSEKPARNTAACSEVQLVAEIPPAARDAAIDHRPTRSEPDAFPTTGKPEVGKTYRGTVTDIKPFGAFVEIYPGVCGLVHISELSSSRVESVGDVCKVGESILVKCLNIDENGKLRLSRRDVDGAIDANAEPSQAVDGVAQVEPTFPPQPALKQAPPVDMKQVVWSVVSPLQTTLQDPNKIVALGPACIPVVIDVFLNPKEPSSGIACNQAVLACVLDMFARKGNQEAAMFLRRIARDEVDLFDVDGQTAYEVAKAFAAAPEPAKRSEQPTLGHDEVAPADIRNVTADTIMPAPKETAPAHGRCSVCGRSEGRVTPCMSCKQLFCDAHGTHYAGMFACPQCLAGASRSWRSAVGRG